MKMDEEQMNIDIPEEDNVPSTKIKKRSKPFLIPYSSKADMIRKIQLIPQKQECINKYLMQL